MITPDSGCSLIDVPVWAYNIIWPELPYQEGCKDHTVFGNLTFVIDGLDYDLPSHHFMKKFVDINEKEDSVCMSSIKPLNIKKEGQENLFVVGDIFMQIYYSIFDRDNDRVGLARAVTKGQEVTHNIYFRSNADLSDNSVDE